MKRIKVTVPWSEGLHLRPAARLVKLARRFHSGITLVVGGAKADATSILGILVLCAGACTVVEIQATGDDEQDAVAAVADFFSSSDFDVLDQLDPNENSGEARKA